MKCAREERRAGLLCVHVCERHCEVMILNTAVVSAGLGLVVGKDLRPIATMEMRACPSEVHCGNTNGFQNILL